MKAWFMRFGQVFLAAVLIFQAFPPAVLADEAHLSLGSALDRARMQNPQVAMAQARVSEQPCCESTRNCADYRCDIPSAGHFIFKHGIEDDDQLSHASRQRHLRRLSSTT